MSDQNFDYIIIGAGIVGLTTAWELRRRAPGAKILVLEKEAGVGAHASGRNSGVLHSGIYYPAQSLRAQVCITGSRRMREFAEEHHIPFRVSGKTIVATQDEDEASIDRLMKNAAESRIPAERLDEEGVRRFEPHARAHRWGVHVPGVAVIDAKTVLQKLCAVLAAQNVQLAFGEPVEAASPALNEVVTSKNRYGYGFLYNCAGAYADLWAKKFGRGLEYTLVPFKGIYHKIRPERASLVQGNIYPVPDMFLPFLGVHISRLVDDEVTVGPTAIPALGRENYGIIEGINLAEAAPILWQLARLYLKDAQHFRRLVHEETRKYTKAAFLKAARRMMPELVREDLVPSSKVGIRPQLINVRTGRLEMDYILERTERSLHVLNAISPAFTGGFAFAELIVNGGEK